MGEIAKKDYKILLMLLIALNITDVITTIIGIKFYSLTELNPLFTLEAKTLTLKLLLPFIFAYFFHSTWKYLTKYQMKMAKVVMGLILIGLDLIMMGVVINNLVWLLYCAIIRPFKIMP